MTIDLAAYLERIGYAGPVRVDRTTLTALHRAHLTSVPYENLDVQLGRRITTDPHAAFDKIVRRGRGGWCYEMNGTFGLALEAAGFAVTRRAAEGGQPDAHLVLTVALDGETIVCDVGFADGPVEPFPLVEGPFTAGGFEFRLESLADGRWRLHNHRFGAAPGFVAGGPNEAGMAATCDWLQTSPESPFVQHATLFRRNGEGFISLIDKTLRTITPEGVARAEIASADDYVTTLRHRFGLDVPEAASLWPAICERHEAYLRRAEERRRLAVSV
jgi:N-hydroxyarylamine O-acetyltransferase